MAGEESEENRCLGFLIVINDTMMKRNTERKGFVSYFHVIAPHQKVCVMLTKTNPHNLAFVILTNKHITY